MRRIIKRGVAATTVLSMLFGFGVGLVNAQTPNEGSGNGFRVSPVRSELTIDKGQSQTITVTIENPTDFPTTARVVINDFISSDKENGEPRLILDEAVDPPKNSFKSLVASVADIPLNPREKKDVPVTVSIPQDANVGGYYGAIRFLPTVINNEGNVGLTASVGTIVLVRVPGDLTEKVNLLGLSAAQGGNPKSFFTSGDVSVLTRLENVGDIHVKPFGKVQVKNMFGKVVKEYELNNTDPRANILPDSIRKFDDSVSKPDGGWFGRYTITANIGYSQGSGNLISASSTFWYLPVWSLVILALIVIALIGGGYLLYRKLAIRPQHSAKRK